MSADSFKNALWLWIKDFIEVGVTVAIILVVLRLALGSHTIVPLVVVTSGSMLHEDRGWFYWLTEHNLSGVDSFPFSSGFARGDMIVTISPYAYSVFPETRLGDVVIYQRDYAKSHESGSTEPIIHRIVGIINIRSDRVSGVEGTIDCYNAEDFGRYIEYVRNCRTHQGECFYPQVPQSEDYRFYITKGDNNLGTDQCGFGGGIALPVNEAQLTARGWIRLPYIGWIKLIFNAILKVLFFWV